MKVIDLSMPIEPHFRWNPDLQIKGDIAAGDQFRISRLTTTCHGFTHVDAKAHFVAHSPTIEATPLDQVVGPCRVLNLRAAPANDGDRAGPPRRRRPRRTRRRDPASLGRLGPSGATTAPRPSGGNAPWLTREAAEWLYARKPTAVAFDFPQDYPIRLLLDGKSAPIDQQVTHDVLLNNGITLIEYLVNTTALERPAHGALRGAASDP